MTSTPTPTTGITPKEKIADILEDINIKSLARKGFGKTDGWLYHKLNGAIVNGKPLEWKPEEIQQLRQALNELGHRIIMASNRL